MIIKPNFSILLKSFAQKKKFKNKNESLEICISYKR